MEEYGLDLPSNEARVHYVTRALEGEDANWVVTLCDDNATSVLSQWHQGDGSRTHWQTGEPEPGSGPSSKEGTPLQPTF